MFSKVCISIHVGLVSYVFLDFNEDNQIFNTIKYFLLVFFNKKVYHIGTDY